MVNQSFWCIWRWIRPDINSGDCYIYDFKARAWTFNHDVFTDQKKYTNFVTDWQGNLFFAYDNSGTSEMRYWKNSDRSTNRSNTTILTKDIDFGDPSRIKKIYNIYVTYRKNGSSISVSYALNGSNNFVTISGTTFGNTDDWDIEKYLFNHITMSEYKN